MSNEAKIMCAFHKTRPPSKEYTAYCTETSVEKADSKHKWTVAFEFDVLQYEREDDAQTVT